MGVFKLLAENSMDIGNDRHVNPKKSGPIRVMRIITRMNIGGPAVQVCGLMREMNYKDFEQRLYTGFCDREEADYLNLVAKDIHAFRIKGLGRRLSLIEDFRALLTLIRIIRDFKPHIVHTHMAKAGVIGRLASLLSFHYSIRVHTFHGHLLHGYFGRMKLAIIIRIEFLLSLVTDHLIAVGKRVRQDLINVGIGLNIPFGTMAPGLILKSIPSKIEAQNYFHLDPNKLYCAFIGRVTQIKRPDRFLEVVQEVHSRNIDLNFLIAGDGELLDFCINMVSKNSLPVRILGWQTDIEEY